MDLSKMKSAVYEMKNYAQLGSWQFRPFRRQDRWTSSPTSKNTQNEAPREKI